MQKDRLAFLEKLLASRGPSGFEEQPQAVVRERMGEVAEQLRTDVHGNVIGGVNTGSKLRVMLAGHADEIGLMITHIDDQGFLYFNSIGGFDTAVLVAQRVIVHGEKGDVQGVIGRKPIHLMSDEDRKSLPKMEDLFIDIGAASKKEAEKHVRVSDAVTLETEPRRLMNGLMASRGLDDRAGAFVITETLREVARRKSKVALWSVSTVQEEVGLRGARTSAFGVDPQVGIAVDVGFTSDYPGMDKKKIGDNKLGGGPIIARGPNINPVVFEGLTAVARAKKIPHQFEAAPRATGTDANAIQLTRAGVAAGLVSVPNRYMHSPNELCSLDDLDNCIALLTEYVLSLEPEDTFIPGESKLRAPRASGRRKKK